MGRQETDWVQTLDEADSQVVKVMREAAIPLLRTSLGVTYVWFGTQKRI